MIDEHELHDTSERFYAAARAVLHGDEGPMLAVWSQSDEVTYCDPRGEIVAGWAALEAYWRQAAASNAAAPAGIQATVQIKHTVVNGTLAYVVTLEEVRTERDQSIMTARATHIYRREDGGIWRLLHRHTDAAPAVRPLERT
jgi:ketosteroid isomerase-like protein